MIQSELHTFIPIPCTYLRSSTVLSMRKAHHERAWVSTQRHHSRADSHSLGRANQQSAYKVPLPYTEES